MNTLNNIHYRFMDCWIDGLLDCCKSRKYAENNASKIFKMPFIYFHSISCIFAFSELKTNNPPIQKSINPSSCGMTMLKLWMLIMALLILLPVPSFAQTADTAGNSNIGIEGIKIKYGVKPDKLILVTNEVMNILKSGKKITVSNSITTTDPAPGEKKCLYVIFPVDGDKRAIKIMDGETFDLAYLQKRYAEFADQKSRGPDKNQKPEKFDRAAFRASVDDALNKVCGKDPSSLKITGIEMIAYSSGFKAISENSETEETMGIAKEWYSNISEILSYMGKNKMEMEIAQDRNLPERMDAAQKNYAELSKKFKYLIEHPIKIKREKIRRKKK